MNEFAYETEIKAGVGVVAYLRTARDGELKPILGKGGSQKIYRSEAAAIRDLLDNLVSYINGHLVRDGEIAGTTRDRAEALFKKGTRQIVKQRGKTKHIDVSIKGQGRACGKIRLKALDE